MYEPFGDTSYSSHTEEEERKLVQGREGWRERGMEGERNGGREGRKEGGREEERKGRREPAEAK
jgi:hypothetical protein